jgi:hypothetical protein
MGAVNRMITGPKGVKRPAAVDARVALIARIATGLVLAASPALADPLRYTSDYSRVQIFEGNPRKIAIETSAPSQEDVKIFWRTHANGQCGEGVETNFEVLAPPRHGIICYRVETSVVKLQIKKEVLSQSSCVGSSMLGRAVYYRPAGSYVGTDSVQFSVLDGKTRLLRAVAGATITISPPLSPQQSQPQSATDASVVGQAPGPMPRCPDPVT